MTALAVNLNSYVAATTSDNGLFLYGEYLHMERPVLESPIWFSQPRMTAPDGSAACVSSLALAAVHFTTYAWYNAGYFPTFWATNCDNSQFWQLNANMYFIWPGSIQFLYGSTRWTCNDFGQDEHGVALFSSTYGGSLAETAWFVSNHVAYAWSFDRVVKVGNPKWAGANVGVTALTNHYAVAGGRLFQWTGDYTGHGTGNQTVDWKYITYGTPDSDLNEIAYAPPLPGSAVNVPGNFGGSDVWAIDYAGHVFTLSELPDVVVK